MKKCLLAPTLLLFLTAKPAQADLWGGDIPLLIEIVFNTLQTMNQLMDQTELLEDQMEGIKDHIDRIKTIERLVNPSNWQDWKDPEVALRRLREIYHTLPEEYKTAKSEMFEQEMSKAMTLAAQMTEEAKSTFQSGKELERRGADASPGVAAKLTASGVGTLVSLQAQSQVAQSQIVTLLTQMLAEGNEQESRRLVSNGESFKGLSQNLQGSDRKMSTLVVPLRMESHE